MQGGPATEEPTLAYIEDRRPASPLGASPRPSLRQITKLMDRASNRDNSFAGCTAKRNLSSVKHSSTNGMAEVDLSSTNSDAGSNTKSFIFLGLIFAMALITLGVVYMAFPKLDDHEYQYIKVPMGLDDAKNLAQVLSRYKEKYYFQVLLAFFLVYIFLQTFAIPGSIFLSMISGFLYPSYMALPLVCLCSGLGASFCYLLSYMICTNLVMKYIPDRVISWQQQVDRHRNHLFNYILFLRVTPFLPNWFINIVSPVINVPLSKFFIATVLGVGPLSFVVIQAGNAIYKLTSYGEAFTWGYLLLLVVAAVLPLLPVLYKQRLREKFE